MVRLIDDLYVIRVKEDRSIVYSPLRRGVFSVDDEGARIVKQFIMRFGVDSRKVQA